MLPDSRELVVVEGRSTNGHQSEGGDGRITVGDLAREMSMSQAAINYRADRLGITYGKDDPFGRFTVTAEQATQIRTFHAKGQRAPRDLDDVVVAKPVAILPQNTPPDHPPAVKLTRETVEIAAPTPKGETRMLALGSGGRITLTVDAAWLALSRAERDLIYGLVDLLDQAEQDGGR